ncbi:hypothetical protein SeMB42_g03173 [Synchytrium endobioticum]|uniref:Uncharacterized protein n=1 Tax=Synchytrium endobioticum TaxID=286115 RepID=A0A507D8A4_9FUNG|nr:hypothetical protein SeMB42_g03173 [Synchytrium endobioticum]
MIKSVVRKLCADTGASVPPDIDFWVSTSSYLSSSDVIQIIGIKTIVHSEERCLSNLTQKIMDLCTVSCRTFNNAFLRCEWY